MRSLLAGLVLVTIGASCAPPPSTPAPGAVTTSATAPSPAEILEAMVAATSRERSPFRRTYEISGWAASRDGTTVEKSEIRSRYVQLFEPPDRFDQVYVDLATGSESRTVAIGPILYTRSGAAWSCAAGPAYRVTTNALIFDQWVAELRRTAKIVPGDAACGPGTCHRLTADFADTTSATPSTVHLDVRIDARTSLLLGYTAVRTYDDDGKQIGATASFEHAVAEHVVDPPSSCAGRG